MPVTPFYAGPRCRIGHCGPLIVACLEGPTEISDLDELERCQNYLGAFYRKISVVTVMNAGYMAINTGVAERGAQIAAQYRDSTAANVIIINGRGLMAVMARTGLAAFSMLDRSGNKLKAFGKISEAMDYLQGAMRDLGTPLTEADAGAVIAFIESPPKTTTPQP